MKKAVARAFLDAEQEIEIGGKRRRFAGFVQAVDDMQIRCVAFMLPEVDRIIRELAVAGKIEPAQAHQSTSGALALSRASMSSLPSDSS